jgi:lipid-A-disaccharide synthase
MDDKVVAELIQEDCTPEMISKEISKIEKGKSGREVMLAKYDILLKKVGDAGASARAANSMFEFIK